MLGSTLTTFSVGARLESVSWYSRAMVCRRDNDKAMNWFKESRRKLIAATLSNLCVLLLSAGALSEPFIKFNMAMKVAIIGIGIVVFALGVAICPNKDDDKKGDN